MERQDRFLLAVLFLATAIFSIAGLAAAGEDSGIPPGVGGEESGVPQSVGAPPSSGDLPGEVVGVPPNVGGCQKKFLDSYRCSLFDRQREMLLSDCTRQWVTIETCVAGCQKVWVDPSLPVSCIEPEPFVGVAPAPACVPAVPCLQLGCGRTDSCGAFCGACPAPAPVPAPIPAPVTIITQFVQPSVPARPLLSVRFPLQQLFLRSASLLDSDCVRPGESALLAVKVQNKGRSKLKDVSFTAIIPELGIRSRTGPHTITAADKLTRFIRVDVPEDAEEGSYFLRLTVNGKGLNRVVHRPFVVDSVC